MTSKSNNFFIKNIYYFLFFIFFLIGVFTFKDYGISVDEEFQRFSGFYWLNYILEFTTFEHLKENALVKLKTISGFTLPNPKDFPFYGVIFDLPLAFLETIFNIQNERNYFLIRHFFNFFIFFLSSIYFYKILRSRYKNEKIILIGTLFYITSPRIFGDIFFNNKDIIFLSLTTIAIYYKFKLIDNFNNINLVYFAIFSALACASRIVGIFIPISFLLFILFSALNKKDYLNNLKNTFLFLIIFLISLYCFWPYLWEDPVKNFLYALKVFSQYSIEIYMMFNGEYILSNFLPISYLPIWISITTPLIILITFLISFFVLLKRFFFRTINIKQFSIHEDFWRGKNEKKDFYIFFNFIIIFLYLVLSNSVLYNGWRQTYFLHFFIIYIACFGVYYLDLKIKNKNLFFVFLIFIFINLIHIVRHHPYQSLYFNGLIYGEKKTKFEIDYWGIAGVHSIKKILESEKNTKKINVGVASFLPLERSLKMLAEDESRRINIVGQNYQDAEYIFNNNISEVNKVFNKKYNIPEEFIKVYEFKLNEFIIYELYKKN